MHYQELVGMTKLYFTAYLNKNVEKSTHMYWFLLFGAGAVYVLSRKLNEVPVVDKAPPPPKFTYCTPQQIFDRLGATSVNGINNFIHSMQMVGRNFIGVPVWEVYFKNGTKTRIHGTEKGPALKTAA